jgi:hypothetical protein
LPSPITFTGTTLNCWAFVVRSASSYCCGLGEFVAVLKGALVCLATGSPSSECGVYSREFLNGIHSVKLFGYYCRSGYVPEVCEERVTFVGSSAM